MRFAAPTTSAVTAIMLLGACGDDGPTTLAEGDVVIAADVTHDERTLSISAAEEDGEVIGEFFMSGHAIRIECADTDTDGVVILGGTVTTGSEVPPGELLGLIIWEGDPDRVLLVGNDIGAGSCTGLLENQHPDEALTDSNELVDGYDIETG